MALVAIPFPSGKARRVLKQEVLHMYAIIATGGKQYRVSEGDTIYIEKLENEVGDVVSLSFN